LHLQSTIKDNRSGKVDQTEGKKARGKKSGNTITERDPGILNPKRRKKTINEKWELAKSAKGKLTSGNCDQETESGKVCIVWLQHGFKHRRTKWGGEMLKKYKERRGSRGEEGGERVKVMITGESNYADWREDVSGNQRAREIVRLPQTFSIARLIVWRKCCGMNAKNFTGAKKDVSKHKKSPILGGTEEGGNSSVRCKTTCKECKG